MNIFIMVLVFLFMAGYYFMDAPNLRVSDTELAVAAAKSDLHAIAECTSMRHTAAIRDLVYDDICVEQYGIVTQTICMNENMSVISCEVVRDRKPDLNFIITAAAPIADTDYNSMIEILEKNYPDAGAFGIFTDGVILGGENSGTRAISDVLTRAAKLDEGQLVYVTQYEIPDAPVAASTPMAAGDCRGGMIAVYRFGRWQCVAPNLAVTCGGDTIWDEDLSECVADEARRPMCAARQTAVLVDDIWECVDPFMDVTCPANQIARLNYATLEWECIDNPNASGRVSKCTPARGVIRGMIGATLRTTSNFCTDCEEMITDPDTCETSCVPMAAKLTDVRCYPGRASECSGSSRAFYFGYPDGPHSQNRKFNCLDCGARGVDMEKSNPPFTAVCK